MHTFDVDAWRFGVAEPRAITGCHRAAHLESSILNFVPIHYSATESTATADFRLPTFAFKLSPSDFRLSPFNNPQAACRMPHAACRMPHAACPILYLLYFHAIMPSSLTPIVELLHYRWAIPIIAELHRSGGGSKFITLVNRVGAARQTLSRTLEELIDAGWVMRNPGYGHPMRPEYILTPAGRRIAPACRKLLLLLRRLHIEDAALRKWPLAVAAVMAGGAKRFNDIRAALPDITARALALALRELQDVALIERTVYDESPPIVEYQLARRAQSVAAVAAQLARATAQARR